MSLDLSTGGRADVAFSFYTGRAGVAAMDADRQAIIAIPVSSMRTADSKVGETGTVDGLTVKVLGFEKSPVTGYIRVAVRFVR